MPAISVVMPVFNAERTVGAALDSLLAQTARDLEIVAVDDGSTDRSRELLEDAAGRDARITVVGSGHGGIVRALQTGISRASAPLIARMDADDWSAPDRLAKQAHLLRDRPDVGVAGCQVDFGGDAARQAGYAAHVRWMNRWNEPGEIALNRFVESPIAHPSVMFRRDLVHRYGGYAEGNFPEDYELWLRWMEAGVRMAKVPEVLLTWNDPPERLSRNDPRYASHAFYRTKARYLARWLAKENPYHPKVTILGAGRLTRRRVEILIEQGVEVSAYVDIDPRKIGRVHDGVPVIGFETLPEAGRAFVLAYVGKRGARELIAGELAKREYVLGRDWLPAA